MNDTQLIALMSAIIFTLGPPSGENVCPFAEAVAIAEELFEHLVTDGTCPTIAPPKEGLAN